MQYTNAIEHLAAELTDSAEVFTRTDYEAKLSFEGSARMAYDHRSTLFVAEDCYDCNFHLKIMQMLYADGSSRSIKELLAIMSDALQYRTATEALKATGYSDKYAGALEAIISILEKSTGNKVTITGIPVRNRNEQSTVCLLVQDGVITIAIQFRS